MRTLWVEGSPKQEQSLSSAMAETFLAAATPDAVGHVERFSVWSEDLLRFGREAALAKFAPLYGEQRTDAQEAAWAQVLDEIERVRGFDRVVVSSPMWNWHVPHALKAWIDIVVQPGASFTLNERGEHVGTLGTGKPAQLILTRSSAYDGRHPELQDFQRPYLEYIFGFLGYDVTTLAVEPTTRWSPEEREAMRAESLEAARVAGASW
ncbi:FMN-dependent NADH-azoreductase [Mycolicibacillus koreensis]|nr:FMN-dependent NADH-azoreductase [Mycolicibacillus koreensis]